MLIKTIVEPELSDEEAREVHELLARERLRARRNAANGDNAVEELSRLYGQDVVSLRVSLLHKVLYEA